MYIGFGLVVHAPRTGDVVRVVELRSFVAEGLGRVP
jgi:peptidoglycan DL-endopeptidase CwlO